MKSIERAHHRWSLALAVALAATMAVLLIVAGAADEASGRGEPPVGDGEGEVDLEPVGTFDSPVNVAFAPGEPNVYVVEQDGTVQVIPNGGSPLEFLDISDEVEAAGTEQGLLGLAFHPDFQGNGLVYAYYTDAPEGDIVVSEFETTSPTQADPESLRQVIRIRHRFADNHNGGQVLFGPDGHMYLATGDGGSGGDPRENAQDKRSLLGKLLRIDPLDPPGDRAYRTPAGNPYKGKKGKDEIYARGLRNPFRFSFDADTARIAIGDVGQHRFEEVDYEGPTSLRNANFGWDRWEGSERYREGDEATTPKAKHHDEPIFVYGRNACGGGCSVIGGVVVRDPSLANLYGRYLFADAYAGRLRSFVPRPRGADDVKYLDQEAVGFPTAFSTDPETHQVYVSTIDGPVYRLEPSVP
jgi:glucose/arabinose dehydrogenase